MEDLTQGWTKLGPFFQNQGNFFYFQKGQERLPLPLPRLKYCFPYHSFSEKNAF